MGGYPANERAGLRPRSRTGHRPNTASSTTATLAAFKSIYWWWRTHRLKNGWCKAAFAGPLLAFPHPAAFRPGSIRRCTSLPNGRPQGLVGWWMQKKRAGRQGCRAGSEPAIHLGLALFFVALVWTGLEAWSVRAASPAPAFRRYPATAVLACIVYLRVPRFPGRGQPPGPGLFQRLAADERVARRRRRAACGARCSQAAVQFNHRMLGQRYRTGSPSPVAVIDPPGRGRRAPWSSPWRCWSSPRPRWASPRSSPTPPVLSQNSAAGPGHDRRAPEPPWPGERHA